MGDAISRLKAKSAMRDMCESFGCSMLSIGEINDVLDSVKDSDAFTYEILEDKTLAITIPKETEFSRILVMEDGTQFGALYYAD